MSLLRIQLEARSCRNKEKELVLKRFFKTAKGEYGEGDKFLGLVSAQIHHIVKRWSDLPISDCIKLLHSSYHEERMIALQILGLKYKKTMLESEKTKIFQIYINNTKYINNWDLVDVNVEHVIGEYLYNKDKALLYNFARSTLLWERRISIISTFTYIKRGEPEHTLQIAKILLKDKHDLIHKAVGWMLREVGKRCDENILTEFLDTYCLLMPRTMLRYSIERLPKEKYYYYLNLK